MLGRLSLALGIATLITALSFPAASEHFRLVTSTNTGTLAADLLWLALKEEGGNHTMETIISATAQSRTLRGIADGNLDFDVFYSGYDKEREQNLRMVNIPLTRGLLGYRMLAVRPDNADRFKNVQTLADLKNTFSFGSGADWPDTKILRHSGLKVITGISNTLWPMLARGRFDAYPRGMNEALQSMALAHARTNNRFIYDTHIVLAYRYDQFFYVAKKQEHKAQIIERGLVKAYDRGSFMKYFNSTPWVKEILADMAQHQRRIIHLPNPLLSTEVRNIPDRFWHQFE